MPARTSTAWGVLYELVGGSPPLGSGADSPPVAVASRHLHQPTGPPSAPISRVGASLDAVVLTALAKDPGQRYQSAVELQDALKRVLAGGRGGRTGQPAGGGRAALRLAGWTGMLPAVPGPAVRGSGRRSPGHRLTVQQAD